jgi:hypothetical protein
MKLPGRLVADTVCSDMLVSNQMLVARINGRFKWLSVEHVFSICSEVKSHLGSHLLKPETRLYTQHRHRHPCVASSVASWILFATLGGTMQGTCIHCSSDCSTCTHTLTVSWTPLSSSYCFFMCNSSFSCCQYLVLDVIPLFNVDCYKLHSGRAEEGLFP